MFRCDPALQSLLKTRASRRWGLPAGAWALVAALLLGLPALILNACSVGSLPVYVCAAALLLLAGLPVFHIGMNVSTLVSLKRGRCLEDVLATGITPAEIVDTVARSACGSLARSALPAFVVLLLVLAALPSDPWLNVIALLWWPALLLLAWAGSHLAQMLILRPAGAVPVLGTAAPLLVILGWSGPAPLAGAGLVWAGFAGRYWAVRGLEEVGTGSVPRSRACRRRSARSEDPVLLREAGRAGVGTVAWPALVLMSWYAWDSFEVYWDHPGPLFQGWIWLFFFWGALFVAASLRTSGALVSEREHRTLEPLIQTALRPEGFARSWVRLGSSLPLWAGALPGALVWCLRTSPEPWAPLALVPVTGLFLMLPAAGAWVGLWVSTCCHNRQEQASRLAFAWLSTLAALALVWGGWSYVIILLDELGWWHGRSATEGLVFLVGPLGSLGLVLPILVRWARARALEELRSLWRGQGPAQGSPNRVAQYFRGALSHVVNPGRMLWGPSLCTAVTFWVDLAADEGELSLEGALILVLLLGMGLVFGVLPWLAVWWFVDRGWGGLLQRPPLVALLVGPAFGVLLAVPAVALFLAALSQLGPPALEGGWIPGLWCGAVLGLLGVVGHLMGRGTGRLRAS